MPNKKHCVVCDRDGHTAFYCPKRVRKPLKSMKLLRSHGRYSRKWEATKRRWYKLNPPVEGYYYCYIGGEPLTRDPILLQMGVEPVMLDHIKSRTRYPELRYELSNIAPACSKHNQSKGSRDLDEL